MYNSRKTDHIDKILNYLLIYRKNNVTSSISPSPQQGRISHVKQKFDKF